MSLYSYTNAPINTKKLGCSMRMRKLFAMFAGGMTCREIAFQEGERLSDVHEAIVTVWARDKAALKSDKQIAHLKAQEEKG